MKSETRQPELGPTRLRISINEGLLEVEGREEFARQIYEDFKVYAAKGRPLGHDAKMEGQSSSGAIKSEVSSQSRRQKSSTGDPHFDKVLDLAARNGNPSLCDYFAKFTPKSHSERNLIFVHYLQNIVGLDSISVDHVYTCYREVQASAPESFRQSLIDTNNKKGWLNTESLDEIEVTIAGQNHLEHKMPKAE